MGKPCERAPKRAVVGADHGGLELRRRIAAHLESLGYGVTDLGTADEGAVDYPDVVRSVCSEFLCGGYELGVVLCGTGIGASIAANKVRGIRCALIHDLYTAEMARAHNDANILAFGGRLRYEHPVEEMIDRFLGASFEGGRHARRIDKITALEADT